LTVDPGMAAGVQVLVIGAGSIGRRHAENLAALGVTAELISWRGYSAELLAKRLASGDVQGVVIATATQIRLDLIGVCGAAGVPFYVEKPLAFRSADLALITAAAAPVAQRSVIGFMMRYHPAFRHLARSDLSDTYRFGFEIGHDVTQWRQNWRFSESYAAKPTGGGVLLDLCHELDMAACLFPGLALAGVDSLGHAAYSGVDMSSQVRLTNGAATGEVAMDYLAPVSTRRIALRGLTKLHDFDLISGQYIITGQGARTLDFPFARNDMFLAAMRDFLAVVQGKVPSTVEHLPRFDLALPSCALIAKAWEARRFTGTIAKDIP
jgi:predicted dehydrogenase